MSYPSRSKSNSSSSSLSSSSSESEDSEHELPPAYPENAPPPLYPAQLVLHPQHWYFHRVLRLAMALPQGPEAAASFHPYCVARLTDREALQIGAAIRAALEWTRPCTHCARMRRGLVNKMQSFLRRELRDPSLMLYTFGSTATHTYTSESDVDLCVVRDTAASYGGAPRFMVEQALWEVYGKLLASPWRDGLSVVTQTVVPIIKRQGVGVVGFDVSLAFCGIRNSALIRRYVEENLSVLQPLIMAVTAWAKDVGILCAAAGLLNTYTLSLMVIYFALRVGAVRHIPISEIGALCSFPRFPELKSTTTATTDWDLTKVGRLFPWFFRFYCGGDFCFEEDVVCVRTGLPLYKADKRGAWPDMPLCVEDPFETHRNTARNVRESMFVVLNAFQHASKEISAKHAIALVPRYRIHACHKPVYQDTTDPEEEDDKEEPVESKRPAADNCEACTPGTVTGGEALATKPVRRCPG